MEKFEIGELIRKERVAQGLIQAELCEGICEPSTMSRIETGTQQPNRANLVALLQRLGIMGEQYYGVQSVKELEQEDLKRKIKNANARFEYAEAIQLLDELEAGYDCSNNINRQFVLWSRATNGRLVEGAVVQYSNREQLEMLGEAIRYTVPRFALEDIGGFLFGLDEMIIIVNIANLYGRLDEPITAIDLYRQLLKYTDKHLLGMSDQAQIVPLIAYNYSKVLGQEERSKEELAIAEIGIQCCVEYGKSRLLGELYINKACALHRLGREPEGKQAMTLGYHVLEAMERWDSVQLVKDHFAKTYGEPID